MQPTNNYANDFLDRYLFYQECLKILLKMAEQLLISEKTGGRRRKKEGFAGGFVFFQKPCLKKLTLHLEKGSGKRFELQYNYLIKYKYSARS